MRRLITLGCSLTHQAGWSQYLATCMQLPLYNLSQSAGSNQLQQKRIQEFIFTNNIASTDIVIWQLTSTMRYYKREKLTENNQKVIEQFKNNKDIHSTMIESNVNIFDKSTRADYLCNSVDDRNEKDEAQVLEDLLFYIISIKKFTSNFFVFLGWKDAIPLEFQEKFKNLLDEHQINYINECLVDWCHQQKLTFDLLNHPTNGSSSRYARDILFPAIEKQLNIKINSVPIWAK